MPLIKNYFQNLPKDYTPSILEVGVDRGVSFLTLVTFLARTKPSFFALGVDVLVQEQVAIMLANLDLQENQQAYLKEGNSLKVIPELIDNNVKFDVILLDGDHNYYTVLNELKHLNDISKEHSIVVIDDYDGRWSDRDLWYSNRDGYENNTLTTKPIDTEKHGVKPAVDEWLAENPTWQLSKPIQGEPVLLTRKR